MDSAVLLDLLGNENRRRILRLLSHKPCYVTEISEYLGVSPKAVIDHLRKLEEAGLIESTTNDQRRKYFHISRSLRLEVSVSPHNFGAKSAYPASTNLDVAGRCPHITVDVVTAAERETLSDLAAEFGRLQEFDQELSLAQRWIHGRLTNVLDELDERLGAESDSRFYAELLAAVAETEGTQTAIVDEVNASSDAVDDALRQLTDAGILSYEDGRFVIRDR